MVDTLDFVICSRESSAELSHGVSPISESPDTRSNSLHIVAIGSIKSYGVITFELEGTFIHVLIHIFAFL